MTESLGWLILGMAPLLGRWSGGDCSGMDVDTMGPLCPPILLSLAVTATARERRRAGMERVSRWDVRSLTKRVAAQATEAGNEVPRAGGGG